MTDDIPRFAASIDCVGDEQYIVMTEDDCGDWVSFKDHEDACEDLRERAELAEAAAKRNGPWQESPPPERGTDGGT